MLVDTHAHLDFNAFKQDLDSVIERAREKDISHIINIGINIESSKQSIALAKNGTIITAVILDVFKSAN